MSTPRFHEYDRIPIRVMEDFKTQALKYHQSKPAGKIQIQISKPVKSVKHLSLAYTPGVAEPCREIEKNPELAYQYTNKGNLVAVISNGTAVLGLGDIGALAGKPVMEGKAVLFKHFANVNSVDIEVNEKDPKKLIEIIEAISPSFGGINLEDIKAPECFKVEEVLKQRLSIPVFHDDQHGTAVVTSAALLNALEIASKDIDKIKVVMIGAGAAGIAIANLILALGVKKKNLFMFDSQGLITRSRKVNKYKQAFAQNVGEQITYGQALKEADVFIGVSKANLLTGKMIKSMAKKPIVFAMANPDPEIKYELAKKEVPDLIMATGRSDYPNQVNNVLCFPFLFRGALDARAREINQEMKLAAVKAIAKLAKEPVTKEVERIYKRKFKFGPDYILPKPFDKRLLLRVSKAVSKAAVESGVTNNLQG
jgi:malate dehydrogenase (oxaloacetate-decarboxylating)(NADP+)